MTELIWTPSAYPVAQTKFNTTAFCEWVTDHDLDDIAHNSNTPLNSLMTDLADDDSLERIVEFGGRHCYRAWERGRARSAYVKNIIDMNHGSVLEHANISFAISGVSRSLSLEMVRHRVGVAISQESQRYVDASDINFVVPPMLAYEYRRGNDDALRTFEESTSASLHEYKRLQEQLGITSKEQDVKTLTSLQKRQNEAARALLPNSCETRLLWTANLRLLRHFFILRGSEAADLEIRRLAVELFDIASELAPSAFADMALADGSFNSHVIVHV